MICLNPALDELVRGAERLVPRGQQSGLHKAPTSDSPFRFVVTWGRERRDPRAVEGIDAVWRSERLGPPKRLT
jgi:hypothetical protein